MSVKLLTAHHFGISKLNRRLHRLVWVYSCQNATLLEIMSRLNYHQLASSRFFLEHCKRAHIERHILDFLRVTHGRSWLGKAVLHHWAPAFWASTRARDEDRHMVWVNGKWSLELNAPKMEFCSLDTLIKFFETCLFYCFFFLPRVLAREFLGVFPLTTELAPWQCSWLVVCLFALRPKSTAMVIAGRSVHLTTLFPGQAWTSG